MLSRRQVLYGGLGVMGAGVMPRIGRGPGPGSGPGGDVGASSPFEPVARHPESIMIDGVPFAPEMSGDRFPNPHARFPDPNQWLRDGEPPHPTETADVVVVGGGLSGLGAAYMLRTFRPVVLEADPRFGGVAQGELWQQVPYSLGGAYVITPDKGSVLEGLYRELGLHHVFRLDEGESEVELNGKLPEGFWAGAGLPPEEQAAFAEYAGVVRYMAGEGYPEIPLPGGRDDRHVLELDQRSLRQDIEDRMKLPVPPLLASAIQAYCYSSFSAGWEEISAASGWNFLAAEEYGRWVFRGGVASMVFRMWQALAALDGPEHRGLRPGSMVVDVRLVAGGVQVTWLDWELNVHSILAKRVVMACPKHVCKYILHDLQALDEAKLESMHALDYVAYVVANVLLNGPVERDFYDIFLLGDGAFPQSADEAAKWSRVTDVLNGRFAYGPAPGPRSVLTLYWPLPWPWAPFTLFAGDATLQDYGSRLVPQLQSMLELLEVDPTDVEQVRLSYWGHAMPVARPDFIALGHARNVRRPLEGRIWFVHQDNWALPAVENCLLDAAEFAPLIATGIG